MARLSIVDRGLSTFDIRHSTISIVPTIVDYPQVLASLTERGLVSLYYNSGAFGFARETATHSAGWLLREDSTIRLAARELAKVVPGDAATLAAMAGRVVGGQGVWLMPKSHWAYELDFGSSAWMPAALTAVGVDPATLISRHDGAAIEFAPAERATFETFVATLLANLKGSDFMFVTADTRTICTVHHHQQLWWTSVDAATIERVRTAS